MKKITMLFILLCTICFQISVSADTVVEVTPSVSANLINPDNIVSSGTCVTLNGKIAVEAESEYVFVFGYSFMGNTRSAWNNDFDVVFENDNGEISDILTCVYTNTYMPTLSYAKFQTPRDASYVMLDGSFNITLSGNTLTDCKGAIELYKNTYASTQLFFDNYHGYIEYVANTNYCSYENNSDYYVISSISNPLSINQIVDLLLIKDNSKVTLGNSNVSVVEDDYTSSKTIVGVYDLSLSVKDAKANETLISLKVVVADTVDPLVTNNVNSLNINLSVVNHFSYKTIFESAFTVLESTDYTFELKNDEVLKDVYKAGQYTYNYIVTDDYGNYSECSVIVNIVDDLSPDVYLSKIILDQNGYEALSNEELAVYINNYLSSIGVSSTNVSIISNDYLDHLNSNGEYNVVFSYEKDGSLICDSLTLSVHEYNETPISNGNNSSNTYLYIGISIIGSISLAAVVIILIKKKHLRIHK